MLLVIVRIDERYVVEYRDCIVYVAFTKSEALQWVSAHSAAYQ